MFDPGAIHRAVTIQQSSYALLRWAVDAIDRGFLRFDAVHTYASFEEAALPWIERHYADLPPGARPAREDLPDFARFFTSYVDSSFDLVEDPGKRLYSPDAHCFCPLCSWLVDVPRLRPKKLGPPDKRRAHKLKLAALHALAVAERRSLSEEEAERLASDPALREAVALVAYGRDLLDRLRGVVEGPATLALWRTFAWTPEGSPRKGFRLDPEAILEAERTLVARLAHLPASTTQAG